MSVFHSVMTEILGLVSVVGVLGMMLSAGLDTLQNRG